MEKDLKQLRYFLAIAKEENFYRAAAQLCIAQPALTRHIHSLEEQLGFALFQRLPRGVRLTEAGRLFMEDVTRILDELEHARHRAAKVAEGQGGSLTIGCSELAIWHTLLPRVFDQFRLRFPDVRFHVVPGPSQGLLELLRKETIDAAFIYSLSDAATDLSTQPIGTDELLVAMSRTHRLARKSRITVADLRSEPMVWMSRAANHRVFEEFANAARERNFTPNIIHESTSFLALLSFVVQGVGITFLPGTMHGGALRNVVLKRVDDFSVTIPLALAWRSSHAPPVLTRFIRLLQEFLKDEPADDERHVGTTEPDPGPAVHLPLTRAM